MEEILDDVVSSADLKKFEEEYHRQLGCSAVIPQTQFEYAWCLVRSSYHGDIRKGILLLEDLFKNPQALDKRDYLYYLATGYARIKEYSKSLQFIKAFLQIEPGNKQVQELEKVVKNRMTKEGLTGMAVAGGAVLAAAGIIGLVGMALSKK
ncbi:mitochondrial fission 1 protein isoform X2 [Neocloeon triangulifer]|uniref:mitochondrial fission 1 protein isoform X2 n=1 Tax=Neocloeon triangulifer TaxID=2078957 RepID=UPI00286F6888|nr:mitochondrial fission 1 protein isoform X2 [Neocloeon triangulifer]